MRAEDSVFFFRPPKKMHMHTDAAVGTKMEKLKCESPIPGRHFFYSRKAEGMLRLPKPVSRDSAVVGSVAAAGIEWTE